jgi:hypothetical protein
VPYQDLATRQQALDEFGVPVTIAGVTAKCFLDDADEEMAAETSSLLVGRGHRLRAATGAFATVAQDDTAVLDGVSYRVVKVVLLHPGDYQHVYIAKV